MDIMATMDDILGVSPAGETAPKGTLQWTMQHGDSSTQAGTENSPVASAPPSSTAPAEEARPKEEIPDGGLKPGAVSDGERVYSHEEMYKMLNPYKPPTDEELEKQRKKEKRDKLFSAIGDGVMALSNLFFTTRGAPNMYTGRNTMSEKTKERYEKMTKEREANQKAYLEGLQRARLADERKAEAERAWQRQLGLDEYNQRRSDAKDERDRQLFDLNLQVQGHKISAADADAKRKAAEARYADELAKAKLESEKARGKAQHASASASNARANYYNNGGASGGKAGEFPWYDRDGKLHYAHSYEAMRQNAIDNDTWEEGTESSTTEVKSARGKTLKTSETKSPGKGRSVKPQKASPTAGNQGGKKSPTA